MPAPVTPAAPLSPTGASGSAAAGPLPSAATLASREFCGGWADRRLSEAYELIDAVLRDNEDAPGGDVRADLFKARAAVEDADVTLAAERKTAAS